MKRRWVGFLAWVGVVVVAIVGAVVVIAIAGVGITRPTLYELADGYRGWFLIRYEDPACPPPSGRGLYQAIQIAGDGRGCTSGAMPRGWHYQRADYVGPSGVRAAAPSVWPLGHSDARKVVIAFIGTESEFRASPQPSWLLAR